jgi:hypothetical protein
MKKVIKTITMNFEEMDEESYIEQLEYSIDRSMKAIQSRIKNSLLVEKQSVSFNANKFHNRLEDELYKISRNVKAIRELKFK